MMILPVLDRLGPALGLPGLLSLSRKISHHAGFGGGVCCIGFTADCPSPERYRWRRFRVFCGASLVFGTLAELR